VRNWGLGGSTVYSSKHKAQGSLSKQGKRKKGAEKRRIFFPNFIHYYVFYRISFYLLCIGRGTAETEKFSECTSLWIVLYFTLRNREGTKRNLSGTQINNFV
jgi:hypothetical protein